ncbi:MAG: acyltransferase [Candidatus Omnitrophica bacterium]|nr:acyltransferase [Candidatus Omnitrophota bacterium]
MFSYFFKILCTAYYRFRFQRFGKGSCVTGPISLRGAKRIQIGEEVTIEGGSSFRVSPGASLVIGRECFIERGAFLCSEGRLIIGRKTYILKNSMVSAGREVVLGEGVWIARDSLVTGQEIVLGNEVILGPGVVILDSDHKLDSGKISMKTGAHLPVHIESHVWIAAKSVILKGVTIGAGSIIGAGSVVTKEVPGHVLAAGTPAKIVKSLETAGHV